MYSESMYMYVDMCVWVYWCMYYRRWPRNFRGKRVEGGAWMRRTQRYEGMGV